MHPQMHLRKRRSHRLKTLYAINTNTNRSGWLMRIFSERATKEPVFSSAVFYSYPIDRSPEYLREEGLIDHENAECRAEWRASMHVSRQAWSASPQSHALMKSIEEVSEHLVNIRRIVCFELGSLGSKEELSSCLTQHFFAFDMASRINSLRGKNEEGVCVVLQDPYYTPRDKLLLAEEYKEEVVDFVQDPDGLLKIDAHTIVMGIYLPMYFPLLQICADLAQPAAVITDRTNADTNRSMYSWGDRSSPRVAKMLEKYKCLNQLGGCYSTKDQGWTSPNHTHWVYGVQMWLKPIPSNTHSESED